MSLSDNENIIEKLGPLAALAGIWEGAQGLDFSPGEEGPVETVYRERIIFEPMGPVQNGPQILYGLRYSTTVWRVCEDEPFHEELGYWMWDSDAGLVMRCFMVPRVVTVNAIGAAEPNAKTFSLTASLGSKTAGVLSNPFLDKAFRTVRYELEVDVHDDDDGSFSYKEDIVLKIHGQEELFHHTDQNTLKRVR